MNSIGPMNFFRTTDTTNTTIWKPGLSHRLKQQCFHSYVFLLSRHKCFLSLFYISYKLYIKVHALLGDMRTVKSLADEQYQRDDNKPDRSNKS